MERGSVNVWTCDECGAHLVAVHVDEGVTPMFLACREPGCHGMGKSAFYPGLPLPEHIADQLAWEWTKASTTQMKRWRREDPAMYDHCQRGGLVLRPLSDAGRAAVEV